jgi:hypothetical protein
MKKIILFCFTLSLLLLSLSYGKNALALIPVGSACSDGKGTCQDPAGAIYKDTTNYLCHSDSACTGAVCCVKTTSSPPTTTPASKSTSTSTPSTTGGGSVTLTNPLGSGIEGTGGVAVVIGRIINLILGVVGSFALLMFVYGGFLMITSAGHSEAVKKGKDTLTWAVLGIAVILGSYTLASYVITGFKGNVKPTALPGAPSIQTGSDTCAAAGGSCVTIPCATDQELSVCIADYQTKNNKTCQQKLCGGLATNICCKPNSTESK